MYAIFFYRHPGRCTGTIQNYKQPSRSYSNLVHCQFHDLCPHFWIYGWSVQSKICDDCRNYDLVCSHSCWIFHGGLFIYKHYLIFYLFIFSNQLFVYFFFFFLFRITMDLSLWEWLLGSEKQVTQQLHQPSSVTFLWKILDPTHWPSFILLFQLEGNYLIQLPTYCGDFTKNFISWN